jgi:hypothetical protein
MSHATIMLSGLAGLIKRAKAPGNAELGNVPKTGTRYPHHEDIVEVRLFSGDTDADVHGYPLSWRRRFHAVDGRK